MSTNPKAIVLNAVKAVELVGEMALEVWLNAALGGHTFPLGAPKSAAIWYAMFREELNGGDEGRVDWISEGGNFPHEGADPFHELQAVYVTFIEGGGAGFTEAMATAVRSIYWKARSANDALVDAGAADMADA